MSEDLVLDAWQKIKKILAETEINFYFHQREIWWCHLGKNLGTEQDGKGNDFRRPVIVLKKFNKHSCLIVPLTKSKKVGKYYFRFSFISAIESVVVCSQLRYIDSRRLKVKMGMISKTDFHLLKEKIAKLMFSD